MTKAECRSKSAANATILLMMAIIAFAIAGCATLRPADPPRVTVVGLLPASSPGMEVRFNVQLRVQNPNETAISYDGIAVDLDLNGKPFASGVSNERGTIARYSEAVLSVPISVSAFAVLRQALGVAEGASLDNIPYEIRGKFGGRVLEGFRFKEEGNLSLPGNTQSAR